MSQEPSQDAIDRARTEAYRLGLTPEQGETLLRTGKTPQQLQAEQAQRRAEIREDIQSFKNEQIGARLRGGELTRHEVRRTYDDSGLVVQKQTLLGERRPAVDTRSDIEIYKDVQAQLRSEGKVFKSPVQIRRDADTGQVREIRGRVAPRFSISDISISAIDQDAMRAYQAERAEMRRLQSMTDDSVFVTPDPLNPFNIAAIPKSEARETSDGFVVSLDPKDPRLRLDQNVGYAAALSKTARISPIKQAPQPSGDIFADVVEGARVGVENLLSDIQVMGKTAAKGFGDLPNYFAAVFGDKRARARTGESLYEIGDITIKAERKTGPDVERDFLGTSFRGAADLITTGKTDVADDYTKIGENIIGNVPYALGGLAVSAATWLGPGAAARLARIGRVGTKAATPRPRFDFDPAFGSFYDRPSVRFGPYNPTRWENPETLAELNKFRMTIDAPKAKDLITPASLKGFEAFGAGSRSERTTFETRSADSSLLLEKSLDEATSTPQMVDTKSFAAATEPTRTTSRTTSNLLGGGAGIFTSTGNLGLFGDTGAGRRRRRQDDSFGIDFLIGGIPVPKTGSPLDQFTKQWNPGVITFGERDALDQGSRFRGGQSTRDARAQQNLLAAYQKMFEGTLPRLDTTGALGQALSTETTQRQQQRAAQTQAAALSQMLSQITGQATALTSMQSVRTTQAARRSFLGGFGFPVPSLSQRSRRKRKGKRGARFNELAYLAPDLVEIGYGKELAKAFNKAYGLSPDPYGPF